MSMAACQKYIYWRQDLCEALSCLGEPPIGELLAQSLYDMGDSPMDAVRYARDMRQAEVGKRTMTPATPWEAQRAIVSAFDAIRDLDSEATKGDFGPSEREDEIRVRMAFARLQEAQEAFFACLCNAPQADAEDAESFLIWSFRQNRIAALGPFEVDAKLVEIC
jgi:hypothetical protein